MLHEENCAPTGGTLGATRAIFGKTVAIYDSIVVIVARTFATSIVIGVEHVATKP
jgi:hypothetical protein